MQGSRTGKIIPDCATAANFAMAWLTPGIKGEELAERFGISNRANTRRIAIQLGLPVRRRGPKPQRRSAN